MKRFFKQHKTLWISLLIALAAALLTAGAVACAVVPATNGEKVSTVAEEKEPPRTEQPPENEREHAPQTEGREERTTAAPQAPTAAPEPYSPEEVAGRILQAMRSTEKRRRALIPIARDHIDEYAYVFEGWKEMPVTEELVVKAKQEAEKWIQVLGESCEGEVRISGYTDPGGYRGSILQARDENDVHIVTLNAETLALLNVDTKSTAGMESILRRDATYGLKDKGEELLLHLPVSEDESITIVHAEGHGSTGTQGDEVWFYSVCCQYTCSDARIYSVEFVYGRPVSISVFPDEECAEENIYFPADARSLGKYAERVSVPEFTAATEEEMAKKPDNLKPEALKKMILDLYRFGTGKSYKGGVELQGYRDMTGLREDYWIVSLEEKQIVLDIAAQTGHILRYRASINMLNEKEEQPWRRYHHTQDAEKAKQMLGDFEKYVKDFAEYYNACCKSPIKRAELTGDVDGYVLLAEIELEDGTLYMLTFEHGLLKEVNYYFNLEASDWGPAGCWGADALVRNRITGETFYSYEAAYGDEPG